MAIRRQRGKLNIEPQLKYIGVIFHGRGRSYAFKTIIHNLIPGDHVVVKTAKGLTFGKVLDTDLKRNSNIKYQWILKKLDLHKIAEEHYAELKRLKIEE